MLIKCGPEFVNDAIEYIGDDKYKCFYLYANMKNYGVCDCDHEAWIALEKNKILGIAYRYFKTLHLYSKEIFPIADAVHLIKDINPSNITGTDEIIQKINTILGGYKKETNYIVMKREKSNIITRVSIELATVKDTQRIAQMMISDPVYSPVYNYQQLCIELEERIRTGSGHVFLIKDTNNDIYACYQTYVETDDVAVCSGLISSPKVRGLGFGALLVCYVTDTMIQQGKVCIAFLNVDNKNTVDLHKGLKFEFIGTWSRLLKIL